ncbi:hypothetical protein HELRODRAFT_181871 [Helobdella robusta]|uniref:Uncharacterized protein n=1 Tax=Helobdella robusta TaxID=6412 RepID=T1FHF0_HELRO|nr:hypothetical protein HELRODRAFT_181871 [Helobdella robusta]ESN91948.1 hypothetical protein HELRODRAFT_181871 [Helobdella robusta]
MPSYTNIQNSIAKTFICFLVLEDVQINKYLQEFQVFRERSSRDTYRSLKRDIANKLKQQKDSNKHHQHHSHTTSNGLGGHKASCASLLFLASSGGSVSSGGTQTQLPTIKENSSSSRANVNNMDGADVKGCMNTSGSVGHLFSMASRKKHSFAFLQSANFRRTITCNESILPTATTTTTNNIIINHNNKNALSSSSSSFLQVPAVSTQPSSSMSTTTTTAHYLHPLRRNQSISLIDRQRVVAPTQSDLIPTTMISGYGSGPSHYPNSNASMVHRKLGVGASIDSCYPALCVVNENGEKVFQDEDLFDGCLHVVQQQQQQQQQPFSGLMMNRNLGFHSSSASTSALVESDEVDCDQFEHTTSSSQNNNGDNNKNNIFTAKNNNNNNSTNNSNNSNNKINNSSSSSSSNNNKTNNNNNNNSNATFLDIEEFNGRNRRVSCPYVQLKSLELSTFFSDYLSLTYEFQSGSQDPSVYKIYSGALLNIAKIAIYKLID